MGFINLQDVLHGNSDKVGQHVKVLSLTVCTINCRNILIDYRFCFIIESCIKLNSCLHMNEGVGKFLLLVCRSGIIVILKVRADINVWIQYLRIKKCWFLVPLTTVYLFICITCQSCIHTYATIFTSDKISLHNPSFDFFGPIIAWSHIRTTDVWS